MIFHRIEASPLCGYVPRNGNSPISDGPRENRRPCVSTTNRRHRPTIQCEDRLEGFATPPKTILAKLFLILDLMPTGDMDDSIRAEQIDAKALGLLPASLAPFFVAPGLGTRRNMGTIRRHYQYGTPGTFAYALASLCYLFLAGNNIWKTGERPHPLERLMAWNDRSIRRINLHRRKREPLLRCESIFSEHQTDIFSG